MAVEDLRRQLALVKEEKADYDELIEDAYTAMRYELEEKAASCDDEKVKNLCQLIKIFSTENKKLAQQIYDLNIQIYLNSNLFNFNLK